ncbi:MAG: GTPase HflX, partial [Candidatus Eremiobacteraeota bacterium]|nr:GTPase HflX [Candidatus Eremiobacteraeota bacterium]
YGPTSCQRALSSWTALHRGTPLADRTIVVAVDTENPKRPLEPELIELEALAEAAGAYLVDRVVQRRAHVDPATLVGSGKAHEIADLVRERNADLVLVLNDLRPRQRKNLEKIISVPIVDRTMLILDVFARHARSREGKLQVELAQLRYRQSNLIGVGADLSRLGGGIGTRGPGETKLEVDRRRIASRISTLRRQLAAVRRARAVRRGRDRREPLVALVGYTNVGKTSLLNALARSGAYVADQPFATLDPTIRRAYLQPGRYIRLADTVGFITDLPPDLIEAFRATLEELQEADLLLHVMDASNSDWPRQRQAVERILHELALDATPRLLVFNKVDRSQAHAPPEAQTVAVSATTGVGLDALRDEIALSLDAGATLRSTNGRRPIGAEEFERGEPAR